MSCESLESLERADRSAQSLERASGSYRGGSTPGASPRARAGEIRLCPSNFGSNPTCASNSGSRRISEYSFFDSDTSPRVLAGASPTAGSSGPSFFFEEARRRSAGGSGTPTAGSSGRSLSLEAYDDSFFRNLSPALVKEILSMPDDADENEEEAVEAVGRSSRSSGSRPRQNRDSRGSRGSRDSRGSGFGSSYDMTKFITMNAGDSRQNIGRDVSRAHMQKFELCRREACAWVRRGEVLVKHPLRRPDGGRFSTLKEMRRKPHVLLSRRKRYTFVVLDRHKTASGHPELRWGRDLGRAVSMQAKGCLMLSEVHYVAATVLNEGEEVSEKLLNEFQIVGSNYSMKVVAPSRESMKLWVVGLLQLSQLARKRNLKFKRTTVDDVLWSSIVREFRRLDKDGSGDISTEELKELNQLTAGGNSNTVSEMLQEFDLDGNGSLQLQEFARLFQALSVKDVLAPWFLKYACSVATDSGMQTRGISEASFLEFLEREQGEAGATGSVFDDLQPPHVETVGGKLHLTELGFSFLLCSSKNPAFDPARGQRVHQDMTRPISHYWVSSSHNTYLERDQLFGKSALEQYQDVLLRGCRCVEIDCWDGDDGEPIVTHGYTATSRLMFQDVVRVCRDYGFVTSPYPLILSLEVHCGPKQLARMGQILTEILGDQLLRLPEGGLATAELVSPAAAMRRVIVKGKVPHELVLASADFQGVSSWPSRASLSSAPSCKSVGGILRERSHSSVGSVDSRAETEAPDGGAPGAWPQASGSCRSLPSRPPRRRVLEPLKQCLQILSRRHGKPPKQFHYDLRLHAECHEAAPGERRRVSFGPTEEARAARAPRPPPLDPDDSLTPSPPPSCPSSPGWRGESQGECSLDNLSVSRDVVGSEHPDTLAAADELAKASHAPGDDSDGDKIEFVDTDGDRIKFARNGIGSIDYWVNGCIKVRCLTKLVLEGSTLHLKGTPAGNWGGSRRTTVPERRLADEAVALFGRSDPAQGARANTDAAAEVPGGSAPVSPRTGKTKRTLLSRLKRGKDGVAAFDAEGMQEYARTLYLVARKPPRGGLWSEEEPPPVLFPCNIMSFNEKKAEKLLGENLNRSREHHRHNLSRVYPMATRTSSSNPDPVPFWLAGVQMVALNCQSMDLPVLINEGLFRNENGGAGYILKPDLPPPPLLQGGCVLDVEVLCGQYLPKPNTKEGDRGTRTTNPMVRVSISGLDEDRKTCVTKQVLDNCFNPRWEEILSFELSQPALSILVFEVVHTRNPAAHSQSMFGCFGRRKSTRRRKPCSCQNVLAGTARRFLSLGRRQGRGAAVATGEQTRRKEKEEVVAAAAIPVSGLREGLRWVQLLDARFHPVERSGLLLNIRLSGAWASERRSVSLASSRAFSPSSPPSSPKDHDRAHLQVPRRDSGAVSSAESSSTRQRRCISLGASPLPQKESIVGPMALAQEMILAV